MLAYSFYLSCSYMVKGEVGCNGGGNDAYFWGMVSARREECEKYFIFCFRFLSNFFIATLVVSFPK